MITIDQIAFDAMREELDNLAHNIALAKRPVYTNGSQDVHRNFRVTAAAKHTTIGSEITTHLMKQILAIVNLLTDPTSQDEEGIKRFADARNYVELAYSAYIGGIAHDKP